MLPGCKRDRGILPISLQPHLYFVWMILSWSFAPLVCLTLVGIGTFSSSTSTADTAMLTLSSSSICLCRAGNTVSSTRGSGKSTVGNTVPDRRGFVRHSCEIPVDHDDDRNDLHKVVELTNYLRPMREMAAKTCTRGRTNYLRLARETAAKACTMRRSAATATTFCCGREKLDTFG